MISEPSLTLAFRGGFSLFDKQLRGVGANPIVSSSATATVAYQRRKTEILSTPLTASSETNNVLNNVNMESAAINRIKNCNSNSNITNRNNFSNNISNNVMINQVQTALSGSAGGVASTNLSNSPHQKHCPQSLQTNPQKQQTIQKKQPQNISNNVKSERLSPGDHQSSISRYNKNWKLFIL